MTAAVALLAAQLALGQPFAWPAEMVWYDPARCSESPINCFDVRQWWSMAAGHDAREWYGVAAACPLEFPLYTRLTITGSWRGLANGERICLDRGGAVVMRPNGTAIVDLLSAYPVWRETLTVQVWPP